MPVRRGGQDRHRRAVLGSVVPSAAQGVPGEHLRHGHRDEVQQAGKPVGLCCASELYYVTTSGGPFDGRFGYDYWKAVAQDCFGIPTVKLLKAENLDIEGADAGKIVDDAIRAYGLV